ncbi:hypothetical protein B0H63DRAFT_181376 [Podospora didyma]|uniref:Uncharacterized protein n=1 Tax=Podospora didyma TaxID=330526 RepID=A0AAE0NPL7_9PEZI|nr:hypothetical protein B0H63DRAFT_181376 [Podospora didyma]
MSSPSSPPGERRWRCGACSECGTLKIELPPRPTRNDDDDDDDYAEPPQKVIPGCTYGRDLGKVRRHKSFVEAAPSHEPSKACFTVYEVPYNAYVDFPYDEDNPPTDLRPIFCVRIYDVTPEACASRARELAVRLHEATRKTRQNEIDGGFYDRIEIVAFPLDASLSVEEKAKQCTAYDDAERACRMATGSAAWYIPWRIMDQRYRRGLMIIDRLDLDSEWEQHLLMEPENRGSLDCASYDKALSDQQDLAPEESPFGSFSFVRWQPRLASEEMEGETVPSAADGLNFRTETFELFAHTLADQFRVREGMDIFYIHFAADGPLGDELRRAKEVETETS